MQSRGNLVVEAIERKHLSMREIELHYRAAITLAILPEQLITGEDIHRHTYVI
jgi:hypothetical protein